MAASTGQETRLTRRQILVLSDLEFHPRYTAAQLGVRSDVLWRLEERGFAIRNAHDQWSITSAGRAIASDRS